MKVYMGLKKVTREGLFKYGLTVYNNKGQVEYEVSKGTAILGDKFGNALEAFIWVVKHISVLYYKGIIPDGEKVELFMDNQVMYDWIVAESAPYPYTIGLADLLFEFSFLQVPLEIIYTKNCVSRVTWGNTEQEKLTSIMDLFQVNKPTTESVGV